MHPCKCGCGQSTEDYNEYVWGHYWRGRSHSVERKQRQSVSMETLHQHGSSYDEGWRQKISDTQHGKTSPRKGCTLTEEQRIAVSEGLRRSPYLEASVKAAARANRGRTRSVETCRRISAAMLGFQHSEETKQHLSEAAKIRFQDSGYKARMLEAMLSGTQMSPNDTELTFQRLLDKHFPSEWKFVGDGQIFIAGRVPDFININGRKLLIELFGDYWHAGEDGQERVDYFRQYGFDTLVVWEHELYDESSLIHRIQEWTNTR